MYKDQGKQREANRQAQARFKAKGITEGITNQGITLPPPGSSIEATTTGDYIKPKRGKDIRCFADLPPDVQSTINTISDSEQEHKRRTAIAINYQHVFPDRFEPCLDPGGAGIVTGKPGDQDYNGICTEDWRAERGR